MPHSFLSNGVLRELLSHATKNEKFLLTKLLDENQTISYSHEKIQEEICLCGGHGITNFFRGSGTGYIDILDDVAEKLNIEDLTPYFSLDSDLSLSHIDEISSLEIPRDEAIKRGIEYAKATEEKIILKILEKSYEVMSINERREFDSMVNDVAQKFGSDPTQKLAGTAGLIVLGKLGSFATYTFLTTTMSAISMGTLGFGVYTTATSTLSVILGPVGWIGLGVATLYTYGMPKYEKLISIVATVGTIRQRVEYEHANQAN